MSQVDAYAAIFACHVQQYAKTATLADDGGPCSSGNAHAETKYQQGVECHIQHGASQYAVHGIGRIALKAHLIVHGERCRHKGRSEQHNAQILLGIRQNGGCGAQPYGQVGEQQMACDGYEHTKRQTVGEAGGRHGACLGKLACPQFARHEVARTVTKEEAYRLNYRHDGEHNAHCCGALCVDFAHKEGVGHVVETCHQHRYDGGHCHGEYHFVNGGLCQKYVIVALLHVNVVRRRNYWLTG